MSKAAKSCSAGFKVARVHFEVVHRTERERVTEREGGEERKSESLPETFLKEKEREGAEGKRGMFRKLETFVTLQILIFQGMNRLKI